MRVSPVPSTQVALLWHMHQPPYRDPIDGRQVLPWVRLHAIKDYLGMVEVLEETPEVHVTFNLVPCLLDQLESYASGETVDAFAARVGSTAGVLLGGYGNGAAPVPAGTDRVITPTTGALIAG